MADENRIKLISPIAANLLEWLIPQGTGSVLAAADSEGALADCIRHRAVKAVFADSSSLISDMSAICAGAEYDRIILMGAFVHPDKDILIRLSALLADDGILAVAADNRYALAAFAGAREGKKWYFDAIEGTDEHAVSKTELERLAHAAGFNDNQISFYYPYPDCSLPLAIYSDEYLPKKGELTNNYRNFEGERLFLFDESKAWDTVIADGEFVHFANSYLMVLDRGRQSLPSFIKYSNDRDDRYNIRTDIIKCGEGFKVYKRAMNESSAEHVDKLADSCAELTERYRDFEKEYGIRIEFNRCRTAAHGVAELEYLTGRTLEEALLGLAEEERYDELCEQIRLFARMVRYNDINSIADIDLIFKNIFVGDNVWTIIDYEWVTHEKDMSDYIIQRAVYYFLQDNKIEPPPAIDLYKEAGVERPELSHNSYECDINREADFQKHVRGGHESLGEMYDRLRCAEKIRYVQPLVASVQMKEEQERLTADMPFEDNIVGELHEISVDMGKRHTVHIYPARACCFVYIKNVHPVCAVSSNGRRINRHLYVFTNINPQMTFTLKNASATLKAELLVRTEGCGDSPVLEAVARALGGIGGAWERLYRKLRK